MSAIKQSTHDEATPAKAKAPRKSGLSPEQILAARGFYAKVTTDPRLISDWVGCNSAKLAGHIRTNRWGQRPWTASEQAENDAFGVELKVKADAINREAFEASLYYSRFHRKAAKRVEVDADKVQVAGGKDEDSLIARLRAAPPFAQVVSSGRLVTGQTTEKTENVGEVEEAVESLRAVLRGDDDVGAEGGPMDGLPAAQPANEDPSQ